MVGSLKARDLVRLTPMTGVGQSQATSVGSAGAGTASIPKAILCYVTDGPWEVYIANEVLDWLESLDHTVHDRVVQAIDILADNGPGLGRPLVDTIRGSSIPNLKELRPGTVRILFTFDPWRSAILLVAGDKAGRWKTWCAEATPIAEQRYKRYLTERGQEEGQP